MLHRARSSPLQIAPFLCNVSRIIHLIQEKCKPIIPPRREDKTVTIGIGFQCPGAVVLCADRQLTKEGGLKYEESKVFTSHIPSVEIDCGAVYAHHRDAALSLFQDIVQAIPVTARLGQEDGLLLPMLATEMLEEIFKQKKAKDVEMLVAFCHGRNGFPPFFMRASGSTIVPAVREYIGVGDSSVIRYMSELLGRFHLTVEEAPMAGVFMVSLANRFIDRCGGGPDVLIMFNGKAEIMGADVIEKAKSKLPDFDNKLSSALWNMLEYAG